MKKFCIDFLLFMTAYFLLLPLTFINYGIVLFKSKDGGSGYFKSTAVNIDKFGNREFRTLWNFSLRKEDGYKFGNPEETISSALGKNERDGTLSKTGKVLANILNFIDKDHCKKSIVEI